MQSFTNNYNRNTGAYDGKIITDAYDGKIAGLYDLEGTLGNGHFAVVKLARHVFTGEKVAVKVIDKTKLDEVSKAHLFQEVRCMKLVQHPNVVRLYQVIDTQTKLYLILELGDGGDLLEFLNKHGHGSGFPEKMAREYFKQLVRAISYCHQLHVVHRDLKPENVVVFKQLGVLKLTDFGFSNKFCPGKKLNTSCGSLAYSAPEILLGDSYDAPAVDIWSLGVILYMLVCGHGPFSHSNDSETLTMIMDCKYDVPTHVSLGCRQLIAKMLVREPDKRATLQQIGQDIWLTQNDSDNKVPEYLPLVTREQVSEEDHTLIIQKMVNGNISTKEEILEALDKNEYNHVTATYFLLAERKLRALRQEQAQKKKELVLPITSLTRSRIQDTQNNKENSDLLVVPSNSTHLSVPRTPGTDGTQSGRVRKCSIVQEEEDDEDDDESDALENTLNRRGSRSEGRINITVQDRLAEAERLKKEVVPSAAAAAAAPPPPPHPQPTSSVTINNNTVAATDIGIKSRDIFDGISGVTKIIGDSDLKDKLGDAGKFINYNNRRNPTVDFRPKTADTIGRVPIKIKLNTDERSNSLDQLESNQHHHHHQKFHYPPQSQQQQPSCAEDISTKFLTDSSTISLPLSTNQSFIPLKSSVPKYKTMPSPTRTNTILTSVTNCLNEIFEEGTDVGSSDSATTTPRLGNSTRHFNTNFATNRTNNNQSASTSNSKRNKVYKPRNTSCSSSDASDDDSDDRKKRAHKIVDSNKPFQSQRRDSHDDSSDSQEPGNGCGGSSSTTSTCQIQVIVDTQSEENNSRRQSNNSGSGGGGGGGGGGGDGGRQKTTQTMGFRKHRAGRRKTGETRLRESQSLNRITEVQESELPSLTSLVINTTSNVPTVPVVNKPKSFSARLFHGFRKNDNNSPTNTLSSTDIHQHNHHNQQHHHQEHCDQYNPKQYQMQQQSIATTPTTASSTVVDNEVEMSLSVELAKALKVTESKSSSTAKKIKMLGRYFQVHKKLCIPLSGIFQRGRLYKAQSCSSILRDKVNRTPLHHVSDVSLCSSKC